MLAELVVKLQFPTSDSRLPTPDSRLPTPDSLIRSALCYMSYPVKFNLSQI
ncbi:MAG: hypothetical protein F6K50_15200 [Moorea sp. SIO3I7]|uniref:hypothetical protein n=1 Tax=Moorena sp. SIO3I8 TaxID=2607833 RepID=UPI0013C14084|nr:hypothetical protein [Moorena sp. SIO3I8]NEN96827.1 hypothetical protein [Moorena sp. SIO3I7]NEO07346.1 hypothetical protein [Moorena sp. SIO3I8]